MFEKHPGFRKRYSRGGFWSGYEHHESTGRKNLDESSAYIRDQQQHHKVAVVDDAQQKLDLFFPAAERRCGMTAAQYMQGLAEEAKAEQGIIRAQPLFHSKYFAFESNVKDKNIIKYENPKTIKYKIDLNKSSE